MRGFKSLAVLLAATVALSATACDEQPTEPEAQATFAKKSPVENNGAPSGAHYTLNVIGMSKDKSADMNGNNGRRIFVKLWGSDTKIMLAEGDFKVLDANGTDGEASFQLPNPDENCDGTTEYSVFVRALGKPGGKAKMQTCYENSDGTWCAVDVDGGVSQIDIERRKGKSVFRNESKDLLYVDYCADFDTDTQTCDRWAVSPLFGDDGASYWWDYDNSGLKIAQLRFYNVETQAWDPDEVYCPVP
ncbi:MAG: hypothetical protein HKP01_07730 [Gemmatimonadetes bacterium]|nr:hypothetical protein [Gemmatimonadota bacterium]